MPKNISLKQLSRASIYTYTVALLLLLYLAFVLNSYFGLKRLSDLQQKELTTHYVTFAQTLSYTASVQATLAEKQATAQKILDIYTTTPLNHLEYVKMFDAQGNVIFSTLPLKNNVADEQLLLTSNIFESEITSNGKTTKNIIFNDGENNLITVVGFTPYSPIFNGDNQRQFFLGIFLFFGFITLVFVIFLKTLIVPLKTWEKLFYKIQAGSREVPNITTDIAEIASLHEALTNMIDKLKEVESNQQEKITKQTAALQSKIEEMNQINAILINRELKMIELKKENENLKDKLKKSSHG